MVEFLLIGFWSLTYLLIIFNSIKYRTEKMVYMPLIAGALNFGWEINAIIESSGYWGHIIWLALDVVILTYNLYILKNNVQRIIYFAIIVLCIFMLYGVFSIRAFDGMLLSSFIIDIIMAIEYVAAVKRISPHTRTLIGLFRLLGDGFAWIANMRLSKAVLMIGIAVLVINMIYLCCCLEFQNSPVEKK